MGSLKGRLISVATIWIALGLVAAGFALSIVFERHVTEQFYDELYVHLDELQRLAQFPSSEHPYLQRDLSDPRYEVALSGFYWEIQRGENVLAKSRSLVGRSLPTPPDPPRDTGVHTHKIAGPTGTLLIAEKVDTRLKDGPPIRFIIGTDQRHLDSVLKNFNTTLAWALSVFGLSMVAAATLLIAFAMKPFETLRRALSRVRSGDSKQLIGAFPSEVVPLVDDLNTLLHSTAEMIQRARTQAGNLAHGLKTPLAILTDEAHQLEEQGSTDAGRTILAECKKMLNQIDYQVTRARSVAMRSTPGVVANVRLAAGEVASALGRLHKDSPIAIEIQFRDPFKVACDPQDLTEMLANIVDNACKHAKSKVTIRCADDEAGHSVNIVVDDDGPGLPPEARRIVFNIGERWDTRKPGTGLGLTIVKDLAELYGGDVKLETSDSGGLSVVLRLLKANVAPIKLVNRPRT